MTIDVLQHKKLSIIKYIEATDKIITVYGGCHKVITELEAFRPLGDVNHVKPSVLSALMTFGLIQEKSLKNINILINDISNKLIPYIVNIMPEYNLKYFNKVVENLLVLKKQLESSCEKQKSIDDFNFNNLTEDNIHKIFNDMAIIIKYYEESQFKLMAINVDYRDYYKYKKPFMIEKLVSDRIKKSYNLMFSICSFLNDIEIFSFLTLISYFVYERNNYKLHYSGEIIITKK